MWLVGFLMQAMGIVLYYQKGLYGDCAMEFFYIGMTVYGFLNWRYLHGEAKPERPVTHFRGRWILPWVLGTAVIWAAIYWVLSRYTPSTVPLTDSFTTALSIVGTWALAQKYLEQWLIWIVVDAVTCALYFYKDIPFKASLYALYVIIAVAGYFKWRKMLKKA